MTRRAAVALAVALLLTRLPIAWLADRPERYRSGATVVTGDPELYRHWAGALVAGRLEPYSEIRIEYPPGSLPFIAAPAAWEAAGHSYRTGFIALMLAVDLAGVAALLALARSGGSIAGAWLWVAALPLLGPITYLRLDLVPAVATLWALQRARLGRWFGAGGWLAFGALAKLYPAALLPAAWAASARRSALVRGAAVAAAVPLLAVAGSLPALWDSVIGYHAGRGIQIESSWGALLLAARGLGADVGIAYDFGAFHTHAPIAPALEVASTLASLALVAALTWVLLLRAAPGDTGRLAAAMLAGLAALLAVTTVFSPQFMLWLAAPAAAWAALAGRDARPAVLVLPAAALSQALYPLLYDRLLVADPVAVMVLAARNLLVVALALSAGRVVLRDASR